MKLRQRESGAEYPVTAGMVLGRVPQCAVTLDDSSVSRQHARIEARAGGLWLVDLGSSNGTRRNGRREKEFPLRAGDLLSLGAVALDVVGEAGDTPAPVAAPEPAQAPAAGEATRRVRSGESTLADAERARIRAELRTVGRARGLGDLGQQPLSVKLLALLIGAGVLVAMYYGVIWLGGNIAPR